MIGLVEARGNTASAQTADFVLRLLRDHSRYAWSAFAQAAIARLPIVCAPCEALPSLPAGTLFIPTDIAFDVAASPMTVNCFGVELTMLDLLSEARFSDFSPVPGLAWLWRNDAGVLMLAWNLAGFVDRFPGFGEERAIAERDRHDRLPIEYSTLARLGVLSRPLLNTYFFAVLSVALAAGTGCFATDPREQILPPVLVLSHDCDQLRGNDVWSQGVRLYRFVAPLKRLRLPAFGQLKHILRNVLYPRRYFFEDALRMLACERRYGFRSAFYFLNGKGGRLGARSGPTIIAEFAKALPHDAELGIHYNYRNALNLPKLRAQLNELAALTGREIRSGRAHYLVFDPVASFDTLKAAGICVDESLGFANSNGFRLGFAGAFRVPGGFDGTASAVVEIPMHFMDSNTGPRDDDFDLMRMAQKVEQVGGIITILYHPGAFDTPEMSELNGVYEGALRHFARHGYRSMLPSELHALLTG